MQQVGLLLEPYVFAGVQQTGFQDNLDLIQEQLALKAHTGRVVASLCWCLRWFKALFSVAPTLAGFWWGAVLVEEPEVARAQLVLGSGNSSAEGPGPGYHRKAAAETTLGDTPPGRARGHAAPPPPPPPPGGTRGRTRRRAGGGAAGRPGGAGGGVG